jgi:hypothetical protein
LETKFEFVEDDELRQSLVNDLAEVNRCLDVGAFKAATVITGSMIECLLTYMLQVSNEPEAKITSMNLKGLVDLAAAKGMLSDGDASACDAIRQYRNLIHPGRVERTGTRPSESRARLALSLLGIVIDGISEYCEHKMLSSPVLMRKAALDPGAVALIKDKVRESTEKDRVRLYLRVRETIVVGADWLTGEDGKPLEIAQRHARLLALLRAIGDCLERPSKELVQSKAISLLDRYGEDYLLYANDEGFSIHLTDPAKATLIRYLSERIRSAAVDDPLILRRIRVLSYLTMFFVSDLETAQEAAEACCMMIFLEKREVCQNDGTRVLSNLSSGEVGAAAVREEMSRHTRVCKAKRTP